MKEKTLNRVSSPISVVGRGVRSFIRWHSEEEEQRLLKQAREAYAKFHGQPIEEPLCFKVLF